ncbi:MAG: lysostaphin resistance A-like protein [Bacteroidota bacterium]
MQNIEQERQSWIKLSVILFFLFLYGLITVLAGDGDVNINYDNKSTIAFLYIGQVLGVVILFILPSVLFSIFWTRSKIHYLGITTKPALGTLLISAVGMLLAMPMINWLAELNLQMQLPEAFNAIETWMKNTEAKATELTEVFTRGTSLTKLMANLFVVALVAAVSEEIFFRGIVQKVLIECFKNKHVGVWIGAVLFSAFHMQFYGFIPRMLMGAYLGYLFLWSGSLWPGMLAHFLNNGLAVYVIWLINKGVISAEVDKIGIQPDQLAFVVSSFIMVMISLFLVYRIEQRRKNLPLQ